MISRDGRVNHPRGTCMTSYFVSPSHKKTWVPARLVIASLAAVIVAGDHAGAASSRKELAMASVESRAAGAPIIAVVSLRNQRVTVYDADGRILRAPVSSAQTGRETPAGIFSVIQKEAGHYSNLFDDAYNAAHAAHHLVEHRAP